MSKYVVHMYIICGLMLGIIVYPELRKEQYLTDRPLVFIAKNFAWQIIGAIPFWIFGYVFSTIVPFDAV